MARLTKAQQADLDRIMSNLVRAQDFLQGDSVVVARKYDRIAHASSEFNSVDPDLKVSLSPINKDYGSDLTGFQMAIDALIKFIDRNR